MRLRNEIFILIAWFSAMSGCDFQGAQATAEAVDIANEKHLALIGMPCLYVCQKYHDHEPCGQSVNTRCTAAADLTRNQ